jgi:hypothetical protein
MTSTKTNLRTVVNRLCLFFLVFVNRSPPRVSFFRLIFFFSPPFNQSETSTDPSRRQPSSAWLRGGFSSPEVIQTTRVGVLQYFYAARRLTRAGGFLSIILFFFFVAAHDYCVYGGGGGEAANKPLRAFGLGADEI